MLKISQKGSLIHNRVYGFFVYYFCFLHFFHCVNLASCLTANFPYFSEATLPDWVHDLKGVFSNKVILLRFPKPTISLYFNLFGLLQGRTIILIHK